MEECIILEKSALPVKVSNKKCSLLMTAKKILAIEMKGEDEASSSSSSSSSTPSLSSTPSRGKKIVCDIDICNVVGAKFFSQSQSHRVFLEIYRYETPSGCCGKGSSRVRVVTIIYFHEQEEVECQNWVNAINGVLARQHTFMLDVEDGGPPSQSSYGTNAALANTRPGAVPPNLVSVTPPKPRNFLVFVNPVSGRGTAKQIWTEFVEPMLQDAGINVKLVYTQHSNHAREYVRDFDGEEDLSTLYDAILAVGGDGIVYEVINGLSDRELRKGQKQLIPISAIPGGTGNGLAKSILFECGEDYSVTNAVFVAIKGVAMNLNISSVTTKTQQYSSFLILGWGLVSDIDILSESMRWMGEPRLYVAAIYFIARHAYYRGRLSLLISPEMDSTSSGSSSTSNTMVMLPPLDTPINPEEKGWVVIEGDFSLVWVVQTSHATATMYSGPGKKMDDGMFQIYVVQGISRCELLQLLISFDSGDHINHPKVKTYKAKAYRLEPLTDQGIFTLDGEVIEYGPIQACMKASGARVLKLPPK